MSDLVKSMNPTAVLATEDDARGAARASVIGIGLGLIRDVAAVAYMLGGGMAQMQQALADKGLGDMADGMAKGTLYFAIAMIVLQVILAVVQWKKPNGAIPIIFIVCLIYGLGSMIYAMSMAGSDAAGGVTTPMWLSILTFVAWLISLVCQIAAVRGASALKRFRNAQAY